MRAVIKIILIIVFSFIVELILPFWSVALVAFCICAMMPSRTMSSFGISFISVFLLWTIMTIGIDSSTNHILTDKIAQLFGIDNIFLLLITALIGGLVAGFGGMTGNLFKVLVTKKRTNRYYS